MANERREYPRFKKTLPVIIHRPYNETKIETADISLIGSSVSGAQKYYDTESTIYIEIILSESDSIFCNARVTSIYPHTKDAQAYRLGLQFLDMSADDKEKLKTYLESSE